MSFIFPSPSVDAPKEYTYFFILFSLPMNWLQFLKNPRSWKTRSGSHAAAPDGSGAHSDPERSPGPCQKTNLLWAAARQWFQALAGNPDGQPLFAPARSRHTDRLRAPDRAAPAEWRSLR